MSIVEFVLTTNEYHINGKMNSSVNTDEFSKWLQNEIDKRGWSQADLAREAGLSRGAVGNVLRQERDPGKEFLIGISRALHIPPEEIFRIAGFLPETRDEDPLAKEAAYLVGLLPEEQKQVVVDYIRFLLEIEEKKKRGR